MNDLCCCVNVDEPAETLKKEIRKSRKSHKCGECGCVIKPGEQYEYYRGFNEDWEFTAITCLACLGIRRDYFKCGWFYGFLREHFEECNGFDYMEIPEEKEEE